MEDCRYFVGSPQTRRMSQAAESLTPSKKAVEDCRYHLGSPQERPASQASKKSSGTKKTHSWLPQAHTSASTSAAGLPPGAARCWSAILSKPRTAESHAVSPTKSQSCSRVASPTKKSQIGSCASSPSKKSKRG